MAPSYYNTRSTRDHFVEPPSLLSRVLAGLPSGLSAQIQQLWDGNSYTATSTSSPRIPRGLRHWSERWHLKRLLNLPHLLVLVWLVVLLWGERWVFQSAIKTCEWGRWERWPKDATPHHLVFLADPQLIDPHTYPGRPWPLDKFTMLHTDNYLKRSYISLQKKLHPDTIFFLGDLFDGGREWKTAHGNTDEPQWANGLRPAGEQAYVKSWNRKYGDDFWLGEYDRFGSIFDKLWNIAGPNAGPWQRGRKLISSLPGNHDLGFGANIQVPIRNRFETYFGEGNRVDVIGNHTFVSVDSVSLSAGSSPHSTKEITEPVEQFLSKVQVLKRKAVAHELSLQAGEERVLRLPHKVEELDRVNFTNLPNLDPGEGTADLPTVLLTHVPLYREKGTPCGPKREHWPPAKPPKGQNTPVFPDERNAISISGGYQYQNVLSEEDSVRLVSTIGNVQRVFSGDDHDYCEIVHAENKNTAREITVKSMSWAMGVRKPGFLMLSMWNPIDASGQSLHSSPSGHGAVSQASPTTESHLCLLPDQLSIFIRYLTLLILTLLALTIRAILTPILHLSHFADPLMETDFSLLPTTKQDTRRREEDDGNRSSNSSTSSTSSNNAQNLAPRSSAARTRSVSPAKGYGLPSSQVRFATPPLPSYGNGNGNGSWAIIDADDYYKDKSNGYASANTRAKKLPPLTVIWREFSRSIWRVAWVTVLVYLYLVYYG
ncbi:hypothetical protein L207DRAFT_492010 [Hyaloscypha variabilis F]|uniref:Uncharacterized protein n=1 Tax=Hyaloscypha variabilis (strain UAMH 11265 / GT02V1 / F) TaxID=1149755 RepID=A0A2J6RIF7_HYAVF|nr:hypothetical protein L207DRAFT_492010 [Hyaloscypha variabilis F]